MNLNNILTKILGNDKKIDEVQIDQKVISEIIDIAREADPHEYVALLSGKIEDNILKVTGLIFLPYDATNTSATMQIFMKPMTTNVVGSIHSHPGPSNLPSDADLQFFSQNGYFHMIICQPYNEYTIGSYDNMGTPMPFKVVDLCDDIDIKNLEDINIDDEFDPEFIKEIQDEQEDKKSADDKQLEAVELSEINKNKPQEVDMMPENNEPNMIELQIEVDGELITKKIPLPPEYEPGDDVEVSINTEKTPGDSIDEITLNVIKQGIYQPENHIIDVSQTSVDEEISNNVELDTKEKTDEEIENEIKSMEEDIERLKKENEELKKSLYK